MKRFKTMATPKQTRVINGIRLANARIDFEGVTAVDAILYVAPLALSIIEASKKELKISEAREIDRRRVRAMVNKLKRLGWLEKNDSRPVGMSITRAGLTAVGAAAE